MNRRIVSMPVQNTAACTIHSRANEPQPSNGSPRNPYCRTSAYGMSAGKSLSSTTFSAADARYVWIPYQATAMSPRMIAGTFAPSTPNDARQITGYGTPVTWLGFATRLQKTCTMPMPTSNASSTCQLDRPSMNRLPAVTYPPTLCTSDIQNAKMLYEPQVCFFRGARSSFVRRGSYCGFAVVARRETVSVITNSSCPRMWCEQPGPAVLRPHDANRISFPRSLGVDEQPRVPGQ